MIKRQYPKEKLDPSVIIVVVKVLVPFLNISNVKKKKKIKYTP